jgi:glycosyltransferase involved in cell wall biosynthesis
MAITRELIARGDEVWVLCNDDSNATRFHDAGARIVRSPLWKRSIGPLDVVPLVHLVRLCRREKFDLVATHTSKGGFLGRLAARAAGVPHVIYHAHAFFFNHMPAGWRRSFYIALERFAARFGDHIITVSEEHRQGAIRAGVDAAERMTTALNGIDLQPFAAADGARARAALGFDAETILLGAVGRLAPYKGFEYLLRGLPAVFAAEPRARLLICGDGPMDAELRRECELAGIAARVHFLGFRRDVPDLLAAFDVFVQPSEREGLSIALLEAAAAGRPAVACTITGNAEIVVEGETGLLVPPADPEALANALQSLLADPARRLAMGAAARRRAEAWFGQERMVAENVAVYDRIVSRAKSGRSPARTHTTIAPESA